MKSNSESEIKPLLPTRGSAWPRTALIVAEHFYPEKIGSGPFCTDLAFWLASRGCDVRVLTMRPHYPVSEDFKSYAGGARDRERIAGVSIERVRPYWRGGRGVVGRVINDISFVAGHRLGALFRRRTRHDLVFAFVPSMFSLSIAQAVDQGPLVAMIHDIESRMADSLGFSRHKMLTAAMAAVEWRLLARAWRIVVPTAQMKREVDGLAGGLGPIVTAPIWASDRVADGTYGPPMPGTVMYSGNIGRKQGFERVLDLADRLARLRPAATVIVQGQGSEEQALKREIASRNLRNLTMSRLVEPEDLGRALARAQVHIVPQAPAAAHYAIPSKVMNIMASGRPFVATAGEGTALMDLVKHSRAGKCVSPDDPGGFADAVCTLLDSPAACRAMGDRGRSYVARHLRRETVLERLIDSFAEPA